MKSKRTQPILKGVKTRAEADEAYDELKHAYMYWHEAHRLYFVTTIQLHYNYLLIKRK